MESSPCSDYFPIDAHQLALTPVGSQFLVGEVFTFVSELEVSGSRTGLPAD
jgi:hypothetical protein